MLAVNVGSATSSGRAQDPLNYIQRSITNSTRLTKLGKRHVAIIIRKVKATGPHGLEDAVARALWVRAYSELVRLQDKLDTLDVMDKAYKPTVWAMFKFSEIIAKFKSPKSSPPRARTPSQGGGASALWSSPKPKDVPPETDGGNGEMA